MRLSAPRILLAAALIVLAACSSNPRYTGSRIDWREPLFLADGRVGMFQVAWDEYESSCGYFSNDTCTEARRVRIHFVAFDPATGALDTLFEPRPPKYEPGQSMHLEAQYSPPRLFYYNEFAPAIYDLASGSHVSPHEDFAVGSSFSRSGNHLVHDRDRLNLVTGITDRPHAFAQLKFSYYDDVAGKAILRRDSIWPGNTWGLPPQSSARMLYDFASGKLDSTKRWPHPGELTSRGEYLMQRLGGSSGNTRRYAVAHRDSLDLENPEYDTVTVTATRYYLHLDLETRRFVAANSDAFNPEKGITVGDFEGHETVHRARDHHPGFPPSPP